MNAEECRAHFDAQPGCANFDAEGRATPERHFGRYLMRIPFWVIFDVEAALANLMRSVGNPHFEAEHRIGRYLMCTRFGLF